jgi:hypothetical protein
MGFIDKLMGKDGGDSSVDSESDEIAEEFADEVEAQETMDDTLEEDEFMEEEPEEEWDTPYRFAEDMLEPDGFASMMDFGRKFAFMQIKQSPQYRDRIRHGAETIEMVSKSMSQLEEVRGGGDDMDLEQIADDFEAAERAIQAAESLSGKEDQMVGEAMALGRDLVEVMGQNFTGGGGNVSSDVTETQERL